jgi:hypothetical protein
LTQHGEVPRRVLSLLTLVAALLAGIGASSSDTPPTALGIAGDRFTVDGEPKFLIFVSYFDGLRPAMTPAGRQRLARDFDYLRETAGVDGIRILPNWRQCDENIYNPHCPPASDGLFDGGNRERPLRPAPLEALDRLLELAAWHGMLVDVTFTRETVVPEMSVPAYREAIVAAARELRGHRNVLFDVQNEFQINGLTEAEAAEIVAAVKAVDPSRIVTASPAGTPEEAGRFARESGAAVVALHDPRVPGWSETATLTSVVTDARRGAAPAVLPIYLQEPTGWGYRGGDDTTSGRFAAAAEAARQAGAAAWTFHQRVGFNLQRESFQDRIARDAALKKELEGLRVLAR